MAFPKDRLKWCTPETILERARKRRSRRKSHGMVGFFELGADARFTRLGEAYEVILETSTAKTLPPDMRANMVFLIDQALEAGYDFLPDLLALDPRARNDAEQVILTSLDL
jgi:hypothetical protein